MRLEFVQGSVMKTHLTLISPHGGIIRCTLLFSKRGGFIRGRAEKSFLFYLLLV